MQRAAALASLALLAGCGGHTGDRVVIETAEGSVTVAAEVADTAPERARGLMGRKSLGVDEGMVFVFPQDTTGAFWMKDTLVPLSIAFYDAGGRIVRILDMAPCKQDPCPLYRPGASYRGALEVNRGAFERWGVRPGDVLRMEG